MPNLSQYILNDPHVLAIFGAGSWDDWANYYDINFNLQFNGALPSHTGPWSTMLGDYATLLWSVQTPALMVCGSHQFVAYSQSGWNAVGHISSATPTTHLISNETGGAPIFPSPQHEERGAYPVTPASGKSGDPIFAGITMPMYVDDEHYDEVVTVSMLTFSNMLNTVSGGGEYVASPARPERRSPVQMMKLSVGSRLFYTTQFHPEANAAAVAAASLPNTQVFAAAADQTGTKLIKNFVYLATQASW